MKHRYSIRKKTPVAKEIPISKSNNTTLNTSRQNSSPIAPNVKSLKIFAQMNFPTFSYFFAKDHESESASCIYCFEKALELYEKQKFGYSIRMFIKVIDLERTNWQAWNNLGVSYLMVRNLNGAINSFHEVIRINKHLEHSYYNIALSYLQFDKSQEAALCIKSAKLVIENPSDLFLELERLILAYGLEKQKTILSKSIYQKISKISEFVTPLPSRSVFIKNLEIVKAHEHENALCIPGFAQTNVEAHDEFLKPNEDIAKTLGVKIRKLRDKVYSDMKYLVKKEIPKNKILDSKYLTQEELKEIKVEFCKEVNERDYEKIDPIMGKLVFFRKFNLKIRKEIYEIAEINCYLPGEVIFKQGEAGENMYVILKGAVTVEKEAKEFGSKNIVVNCMYDGKQFGELALLNAISSQNAKNERAATCIACEKTYMLSMPKKQMSDIVLLSNKQEIDEKTNFFHQLAFFKGYDRSLLIPLASNIEKQVFRLNDIVLEKGHMPRGLYIISEGYAVLYTEGYAVKDRFTGDFSPIRTQKPKPKPMYFSVTPPNRMRKDKIEKDETPVLKKSKEFQVAALETIKTIKKFVKVNDLSHVHDNGYLIKDRLAHATIQKGDFFGGRMLLQGFPGNTTEETPSKFSVVVQSSEFEVYILTKYHLQFLTQNMCEQLMTILMKSSEVDCPTDVDPETMDTLFCSWQDYKKDLIKQIHKENYLAKHKHAYPFNL